MDQEDKNLKSKSKIQKRGEINIYVDRNTISVIFYKYYFVSGYDFSFEKGWDCGKKYE